MFDNTLVPETLNFIKSLRPGDLPDDSYLSGGTAIALQIGHRISVDLDFFTPNVFSEQEWLQKFENQFDFNLFQKDWQTLNGNVKDVKLSLFYYKYKLVDEKVDFYGIKLASLPDLCANKLDTVISRSAKRDLVDIYFLAQKFGIPQMFDFYDQKYGNFEDREIMIKKALLYFDDAENDPNPNMLVNFDWNELKKYFKKEVKI